jgi:hypothetical protein
MGAHIETHGQRVSLAERRFQFWDAESRRRRLEDWETDELERAHWEMRRSGHRDFIRAQAAPPPPRKRGKK